MRILDEKLIADKEFLERTLNPGILRDRIYNGMNFSQTLPDYRDPVQVAYYMMKYGKYYAMEYYWIYDLTLRVLSDSQTETCAITYSFGCGSMIDGVSLCYAHKRLLNLYTVYQLKKKLYYRGIDQVRWADEGMLDGGLIRAYDDQSLDLKGFLDTGMIDFWDVHKSFSANIISFPKMLSEDLDDQQNGPSIIDQFCERLREAELNRPYIVLCVSYRGSLTFDEDNRVASRIIRAMEEKGFVKAPFAMDDYHDWISYDYFELVDRENMVFQSKADVRVDYANLFCDFEVPYEVKRYMERGEILIHNCEGNITAEMVNNYDRVSQICADCFRNCKLLSNPRKNINIQKSDGRVDRTCFQVLPFRRSIQ